MAKLILLRHGLSAWNEKNLFTGWVDIPLSEKGVLESIAGGKKIANLPIDAIYTSTLIRSHMTLSLAMLQHESKKVPVFLHPGQGKLGTWGEIYSEEARLSTVPVHMASELNERMYGRLQGMNKAEMAELYGPDQVKIWRRSFDAIPPEGESLAMTAARAFPYFEREILPRLKKGENIFVCAHGNSLRAIVMHLDKLSKDEVVQLEIATGDPLIYEFTGSRCDRLSR